MLLPSTSPSTPVFSHTGKRYNRIKGVNINFPLAFALSRSHIAFSSGRWEYHLRILQNCFNFWVSPCLLWNSWLIPTWTLLFWIYFLLSLLMSPTTSHHSLLPLMKYSVQFIYIYLPIYLSVYLIHHLPICIFVHAIASDNNSQPFIILCTGLRSLLTWFRPWLHQL